MTRALIVEDDARSLKALAELAAEEGFDVDTASSLAEARRCMRQGVPEVILCDLMLPDGSGTELLEEMADEPLAEVVLITGNASVRTAVEALRLGAYDYLTKPVDVARLKVILTRVMQKRELEEEISSLRDELRRLGRFGPLVGSSAPMQKVYDLIDRVAPTDASVMIVGESGTGKELVASTIHQLSKRAGETFLPLNCGAVSPSLIESELFGHEKGAFTGANRRHLGVFERASSGTLFLDEITEMSAELQVKLLRVLETGQILRVGGKEPIDVDVRILAATNRPPEKAMEDGQLREDLYYRLNVFPIDLPPLRHREDDIPQLARHFLEQLNQKEDVEKDIAPSALEHLKHYEWPGNVRQLKNVVQRAHILADNEVDEGCLPAEVRGGTSIGGASMRVKVGRSIAETERLLILATLDELEGDKRKAAEVLGISLKTLYNRLNKYEDEGLLPSS